MPTIIPTILATTEEEYRTRIDLLNSNTQLFQGWVQIDLMDNKFVQNKSVTLDIVSKYKTDYKKEAHLMVEYPEAWIDELIKISMDRVIFPAEDGEGIKERIEHLKNHRIDVGLSLNPETPVEKILPFVSTIDLVLVMSVHPGFSGQKFIPETLEKIRQIKRYKEGNSFIIEVDGGVDEDVAKELVEAGADNLVIGSHIFHGDIKENLEKIWKSIQR